jgi:hypothetical protein
LHYFGWCHGIAGTSRLYYKLYQITKEQQWLQVIRKSAASVMTGGIPDTLQRGFWNKVSQCCRTVGLSEYYFNIHHSLGDGTYLPFSNKLTNSLLACATHDSTGLKWLQAEHRALPHHLLAQSGYMQGAAGIGVWLLHLDAYENGIEPIIKFPDNQF